MTSPLLSDAQARLLAYLVDGRFLGEIAVFADRVDLSSQRIYQALATLLLRGLITQEALGDGVFSFRVTGAGRARFREHSVRQNRNQR